MPVTRAIPQNDTAEQAVIGCLLNGASPYVVPLRSDHFGAPDHRLVYEAICDLSEQRQPVDIMSVRSRLESKGQLEHAGGDPSRFLVSGIGGDAILAHYFPDLESARRNREAVLHIHQHLDDLAALRVDASAFAEQLAEIAAPVSAASHSDSAAAILAEIEARETRGEKREAFPSGLEPLDAYLSGGWFRKDLAVIAGNTGDGKSALLMQSAAACADAGHKVRYFTIELSKDAIFDRMACALRGVTQQDMTKFNSARCGLSALSLKIHDGFTTLAEISGEIRAAVRSGDCDLAVVDYVQRVSHKGDTRELEVAAIARGLKTVAQRENIVVLTASQLNEEGKLRESRVIGQEADFIAKITPEGLLVEKFRRGPRDILLNCRLLGAQSRFVSTSSR